MYIYIRVIVESVHVMFCNESTCTVPPRQFGGAS